MALSAQVKVRRNALSGGTMTINQGKKGIRQIAQKMPAVRDLNRAWSALTNTVSISASPIPCNDLSPRILTKPACQCLCLPIREEIDHHVSFKVDENRPVTAPTAPRPIVDTENAWTQTCA
jgi:hypothetical protein